jgi:hypothetical protein
MNNEQLEKINKEINRLFSRKIVSDIPDLQVYIDGRIDSLKWVKENI